MTKQPAFEPEWIPVSEAAALAGVKDAKTIRNWIEAGYIVARRFETSPYQVSRLSLLAYLEKKNAGAD